jgi:hypothetical protein
MESTIQVRLVLVDPPAGIDFGLQRGRGPAYESVSVQRSNGGDLCFDFPLVVTDSRKDGLPNFLGPLAQGPVVGRFVYIGVGTHAGQTDTPWSRRIKVPLLGITWPLIQTVVTTPGHRLEARIPGTGKDGGPSCATIRLLGEWQVTV